MKQTSNIILASGSPRRQSLLKELGVEFTVVLKEIDENYPEHLKEEEVALFLAQKKANAYKEEIENDTIVITADTIVCVDNLILNKPENFDSALMMLRLLSGRTHRVITAVCISGKGLSHCFHVVTSVRFKSFSEAEINYYIETCRPFDKAGGYGIQEWIGLIGLEHLEGSYNNVVGLPVKELYEILVDLKIINCQ